MNVAQCLEKGLLAKMPADAAMAQRSLATAAHKLELAGKELEAGLHEGALISAYACAFHSARALLFGDGMKEKSHYAVYVYVEEKYGGRIEKRLLDAFSAMRMNRHLVLYGFYEKDTEAGEKPAREAVETAREFLEAIRGILG